jgi:hypothetical protein
MLLVRCERVSEEVENNKLKRKEKKKCREQTEDRKVNSERGEGNFSLKLES